MKFKVKIVAGGMEYLCTAESEQDRDAAYTRIINLMLFDMGFDYPAAQNANNAATMSRLIPNIKTEFS